MVNTQKKIKIRLPNNWEDISNRNGNGPPTFIIGNKNEPGVLQISFVEYTGGVKPNPDFNDLLILSENIGQKNEFGQVTGKSSGPCKFGKYGTVEFTGTDFPYISVWHLSNGKDFVFATFICSQNPTAAELTDVKTIITNIKRKRWPF